MMRARIRRWCRPLLVVMCAICLVMVHAMLLRFSGTGVWRMELPQGADGAAMLAQLEPRAINACAYGLARCEVGIRSQLIEDARVAQPIRFDRTAMGVRLLDGHYPQPGTRQAAVSQRLALMAGGSAVVLDDTLYIGKDSYTICGVYVERRLTPWISLGGMPDVLAFAPTPWPGGMAYVIMESERSALAFGGVSDALYQQSDQRSTEFLALNLGQQSRLIRWLLKAEGIVLCMLIARRIFRALRRKRDGLIIALNPSQLYRESWRAYLCGAAQALGRNWDSLMCVLLPPALLVVFFVRQGIPAGLLPERLFSLSSWWQFLERAPFWIEVPPLPIHALRWFQRLRTAGLLLSVAGWAAFAASFHAPSSCQDSPARADAHPRNQA